MKMVKKANGKGDSVRYQRVDLARDDSSDESDDLDRVLGPPRKPVQSTAESSRKHRTCRACLITFTVLFTLAGLTSVIIYSTVVFPDGIKQLLANNETGWSIYSRNGSTHISNQTVVGNNTDEYETTTETETEATTPATSKATTEKKQEKRLTSQLEQEQERRLTSQLKQEQERRLTSQLEQDDVDEEEYLLYQDKKRNNVHWKESYGLDDFLMPNTAEAFERDDEEDNYSSWMMSDDFDQTANFVPDQSVEDLLKEKLKSNQYRKQGQGPQQNMNVIQKDQGPRNNNNKKMNTEKAVDKEMDSEEGKDELVPSKTSSVETTSETSEKVNVTTTVEEDVSSSTETNLTDGDVSWTEHIWHESRYNGYWQAGILCTILALLLLLIATCYACRHRRRERAKRRHFARLVNDLNATEKFTLVTPSDDDVSD